jgi:hypothetical protein
MKHHLIFEGAELTGKSFVISQVYNFLEKKYSSNIYPHILDGCLWINADIGIFGTPNGKKIINNYITQIKILNNHNIIFEKFHITDQVYSLLYRKKIINYKIIEKKLKKLNFKIVYLYTEPSILNISKRLKDRLKLYPHYQRIKQNPRDYLIQQQVYEQMLEKTTLPILKINSTKLPNNQITKKILKWLKEI